MSHGTLSADSVIRGHHVYKDVWILVVGEDWMCQCELGYPRDPLAIFVFKDSTIVGHVPRKVSAICSMFLQMEGAL